MNDKLYQKCKIILKINNDTNDGIVDDQGSCNKIESLVPLLLKNIPSNCQEYLPIIQPTLRIILQFWTKGTQSVNDKWSKSCLGLATSLALYLPIDKSNSDSSKYAKLLGFVLAKVTSMGTEEMIIIYLEAILRHFTFDSLKDTNFSSMVPIFYHLISEMLCRRKTHSSNYEIQRFSKLLIKCLEIDVLSYLLDQEETGGKSQKLLVSFIDSCVKWSFIVETEILQNSSLGCLNDVDTCRAKIYDIIKCISCPNLLTSTIEQISRQIPLLKNSHSRIEIIGSHLTDFLSDLCRQRTENSGIYSTINNEEEMISQCRVIIYLSYEVNALAPKMISKKQNQLHKIIGEVFRNAGSFITTCYNLLNADLSRWEWALFLDLLDDTNIPLRFASAQIEFSGLSCIDRGLISKLVVFILTRCTSFSQPNHTDVERTLIFTILSKFTHSSDIQIMEFTSKLLSLSFQTALKDEVLSEAVVIDLLSVTLAHLGETLSVNIPLFDYLVKIMPVAMTRITPSDQSSPHHKAFYSRFLQHFSLFMTRWIAVEMTQREKINLFASFFPSVWTQCERICSTDTNLLSDVSEFLLLSNNVLNSISEAISVSILDHLAILFSRWVVFFVTTTVSSELDQKRHEILRNHFMESWLSHFSVHLGSTLEREWEMSIDWNSFCCRCKPFVENSLTQLALLFSINQDENFQLFTLSVLSQIYWRYEFRWRSESCIIQYQNLSTNSYVTLNEFLEGQSKRGKSKKSKPTLGPISRFRCAVMQMRWKLCDKYSIESEPSNFFSCNITAEIIAANKYVKDILFQNNIQPTETYDMLELCHQLDIIMGLQGDFTHRLQFLEAILEISMNAEITWKEKIHQYVMKKKFLLMVWCLHSGCFEEYDLVRQLAIEEADVNLSLWITTAASYFYFLTGRNVKPSDVDSFRMLTETIIKSYKSGKEFQHGAWVSLLYSKLQLLLFGNLHEALIWSKQALNFRSGNENRMADLEVEFEIMLQISDIYDCIGSIEKSLSYLSEAKLIASTGFGVATHLREIYSLHGLRIWKRAGSSRFNIELERRFEGLSDSDLLILQKIQEGYQFIKDVSTAPSPDALHKTFQYRYLNILWNTEYRNLEYLEPLNLKTKSLLQQIPTVNFETPCFSGFSKLSGEYIGNLFTSEGLLRSEYFDIQRDIRRRSALNILLQPLESLSVPNSSQIPFDDFLTWFMIASSINVSLEKNLSDSSHVPRPGLSSIQFRNVYSGDFSAIQQIQDHFSHSNEIICSVVCDRISRRILISRLDRHQTFTISLAANVSQDVTALLSEWNEIMSMNRSQLSQTADPQMVLSWKTADKKRWWLERDNLDLRIEGVLRNLEDKLGVWKCLFTSPNTVAISEDVIQSIRSVIVRGSTKSKEGIKQSLDANLINEVLSSFTSWIKLVLSDGALTDECDQITAIQDLCNWLSIVIDLQLTHDECLQWSIQIVRNVRGSLTPTVDPSMTHESIEEITARLASLKVADLKTQLKEHGLDLSGKKGELHDRLLQYLKSTHSPCISDTHVKSSVQDHLVLILDESFQCIPFECLPILRSKSCSRVPSLLFLLQNANLEENKPLERDSSLKSKVKNRSKMQENVVLSSPDVVSLSKCWYSIDPEANLVNTRANLMEFLDRYIKKWNWRGFAGHLPPADVVREYHESSDLFVYCGHGSGEKLFTESNRLSKLRCPAALLWGCSSGVLTRYGVHDPLGAPITYLLNGAPWVIGNLWDVTDRDIDKLSITCMEKLFDDTNHSKMENSLISTSLSQARDICKLKHAVGCAPVLYGLPSRIDYQ